MAKYYYNKYKADLKGDLLATRSYTTETVVGLFNGIYGSGSLDTGTSLGQTLTYYTHSGNFYGISDYTNYTPSVFLSTLHNYYKNKELYFNILRGNIPVPHGIKVTSTNSVEVYVYNTPAKFTRGALVESNIQAEDGFYPVDGVHSDGGWYVRGALVNTAPTTPGVFTSPANGTVLKGGQSATLAWGVSTDKDGDLNGYEVEESLNGGTFARISSPVTNTIARTITSTKSITSITWRVRAKDSAGAYSPYRTSSTYTINHNTAPVVTLATPPNNQTLYENDTYIIDGTVLETNVGDTVTVRYQIGAGTERAIKAYLSTGTLETFGKQLTFRGGSLYDGGTLIASNLTDGVPHTLKVWGTDDKGGTSAIVERTFYVVPNRVPLLTVNTPIIKGNIDADFININGTFSDPDANNAIVSYRINGGNSVQIAEGVSGVFDFTVSFGQLIIGDNIILIEVIDSYGAKTSKSIKLHKEAIETPLLESTQRYQLLPPSGSTVGVLFYIQRDAALDMDVSISMTQEAEAEQYTTLEPITTAPISSGSGIVEDEYYHAAPDPAEKILLQIDFTRTSLTANEKIYVVMGAFE